MEARVSILRTLRSDPEVDAEDKQLIDIAISAYDPGLPQDERITYILGNGSARQLVRDWSRGDLRDIFFRALRFVHTLTDSPLIYHSCTSVRNPVTIRLPPVFHSVTTSL